MTTFLTFASAGAAKCPLVGSAAEVGVDAERLDDLLGREATTQRFATCSMGSSSAARSISAGLWIESFCSAVRDNGAQNRGATSGIHAAL